MKAALLRDRLLLRSSRRMICRRSIHCGSSVNTPARLRGSAFVAFQSKSPLAAPPPFSSQTISPSVNAISRVAARSGRAPLIGASSASPSISCAFGSPSQCRTSRLTHFDCAASGEANKMKWEEFVERRRDFRPQRGRRRQVGLVAEHVDHAPAVPGFGIDLNPFLETACYVLTRRMAVRDEGAVARLARSTRFERICRPCVPRCDGRGDVDRYRIAAGRFLRSFQATRVWPHTPLPDRMRSQPRFTRRICPGCLRCTRHFPCRRG